MYQNNNNNLYHNYSLQEPSLYGAEAIPKNFNPSVDVPISPPAPHGNIIAPLWTAVIAVAAAAGCISGESWTLPAAIICLYAGWFIHILPFKKYKLPIFIGFLFCNAAAAVLTVCLRLVFPSFFAAVSQDLFFISGMLVYVCTSLFLSLSFPLRYIIMKRRCSFAVKAVCSRQPLRSGVRFVTYTREYAYYYNNKLYKVTLSSGKPRPFVGTLNILMIDPDKPDVFYDPSQPKFFTFLVCIFSGAASALFGLMFIIETITDTMPL